MGKRLIARLALVCATIAVVASQCLAGSYQGVTGIPFVGASDDRGIAVNSNPSSPYYGYVYGVNQTKHNISIWSPNSGGAGATAYTDTGNTIGYSSLPASTLLINAFVGSDGTVWVVDYNARAIVTGPPNGGNFTVQFQPTNKPRGIFVRGALGAEGTRVYVAEYGAGNKCEIWQYHAGAWSQLTDLGTLGLTNPSAVTVDAAGNSYWMAFATSPAATPKTLIAKVKETPGSPPTFAADPSFTFTKPAFLGDSWTPGGITYVNDPSDTANPEYIYVGAYAVTSCLRIDLNGTPIDGYGNIAASSATIPWTSLNLSGPGGNQRVYVSSDDQRNSYVQVTYPGLTVQAYKVHLQGVPGVPSAAETSNDVYGQIRLKWTPPAAGMDNPTGYKIYRGTASGNETLYATTDSYPKWKDSTQGITPGGPFYYKVTSFNGAGESGFSNEVGPISVAASTAPAPGSLGVAVSYSEVNAADTVNNPGYTNAWATTGQFLADRSVAYAKVFDADTGMGPTVENDAIAGYKLLILALNRNMSSYTTQCIKDYVNYSHGTVFSDYYNSIADANGTRGTNFRLADVYRANALNIGAGGSPFDSDSTGVKYRYLQPVLGAPEASSLFAGLMGGADPFIGAQQWNTLTYLAGAYGDGTASEVGKWYNSDHLTQSQSDPNDVSLIVGYRDSSRTSVQSVYTGGNWWGQCTGNTSAGFGPGTFSADRLLENILSFLGVSVSTPPPSTTTAGSAKQKPDGYGVVLAGKVVSWVKTPGSGAVFYIEEPDRSSGIRVVNGPLVTEGDVISLTGMLQTPTGAAEREINAFEVLSTGTASVPNPLYVINKNVGGGAQGKQTGVTNALGLNNVGLLVTTAGKLTEFGADNFGNLFFRIDDGSNVMLGSQTVPGIKVIGLSPSANLGDYVSGTGEVGLELDGTTVVPVIRLRDTDIGTLLNP